jgi:hypothetical protein
MMRFVFAAVALWAVGGNFARGACPPQYTQNFDFVTPPALPAGWTASQGMNLTGAPLWITSAITPDTPPNDAFSTAPDNILDNRLDTPPIFVSTNDFSGSFWHSYNLQAGFDGAVLEISNPSINGGAFTDVTDPAVGGHFDPGTGYNTTISAASQSPLAGRMAWGGNSNGYVRCGLIFGMPFSQVFLAALFSAFGWSLITAAPPEAGELIPFVGSIANVIRRARRRVLQRPRQPRPRHQHQPRCRLPRRLQQRRLSQHPRRLRR